MARAWRAWACVLLLAAGAGAMQEPPSLGVQGQQRNALQAGLHSFGQQLLNTGNTSVVVAAAAAAGVSVLKKAWIGLDLKKKMDNVFTKDKEAVHPFNAVMQDGRGMLEKGDDLMRSTTKAMESTTKAMDKTWQDIKWLPHEWEELKNTLSVPKEWTEGFRRQTQAVQQQVETVRTEFKTVKSELQDQIREGWEDGMKLLHTIKRSTSFESRAEAGQSRSHSPWEHVEKFKREGGEAIENFRREGGEAISSGIESTVSKLRDLQESFTQRFDVIKHHAAKVGPGNNAAKAKAKIATQEVMKQNNVLVDRLLKITEGDGWELVMTQGPVTVYRKKILSEYKGGEKFYCIKAVATIDAKPTDVYDLLKDPDRVSEYNDECGATQELPPLSDDTRLTWAASKKYGPFKARDFITRVHHRKMNDGTYIVMSQSEDVEFTPQQKDYVRTEVLLAGNVIRPSGSDPNKTEFTTIAHINPGGAADSPLGAKLVNHICTHGPINFILKLEGAAGHGLDHKLQPL